MMFWYGGGWSLWQVGLMGVGMIAFWGLLGWAVYRLITSSTRAPRTVAAAEADARLILDARFARGEIDAEQYRRARSLLAEGSGVRLDKRAGR